MSDYRDSRPAGDPDGPDGREDEMYMRARRRERTFADAEKKTLSSKASSAARTVGDGVRFAGAQVKAGADRIDQHLPAYEARKARSEERAERRAERKGRKAYAREMRAWEKQYYDTDSVEYERHIDELCYHILDEQKSFVEYATDMKSWMKEADARKEMDRRNDEYCRNMFDYCVSPLQHGISAESVVDTIGLYVGMSMFSPEFRNNIGAELDRLMMPLRDRVGERAAMKKDKILERNLRFAKAIEKRAGHECSNLEMCDPPATPGRTAKWAKEYIASHYSGENLVAHKARMQARAEQISMAKNRGRVPLSPETAALQQLNFMHNYYKLQRDPSLNQEDVAKDYKTATETLKELMKRDGVDQGDFNQSFRTIVGQLSSRFPELECEFGGLAFDDYVKSDGELSEHPSKKLGEKAPCYTWQGEYISRETGKPYDGGFYTRGTYDVDVYKLKMGKYFTDIFDKMDTPEKLRAALESPWMEKVQDRFITMMSADFPYLDKTSPLDSPRDPYRTFDEVIASVGEDYMAKHPDVAKEFARQEEQTRETQRRRRCDFGPDDVTDYSEGGPDYG